MSKDRDYSNGEIVVQWRPALCCHCGTCLAGLPQVFNLTPPPHTPWADVTKATTAELREQVAQCPTGALSIAEADADGPH